MKNPNNCKTYTHTQTPDGGHCAQYTSRKTLDTFLKDKFPVEGLRPGEFAVLSATTKPKNKN